MDRPGSEVREKLFRRFVGEFTKEKDITLYVQASDGLTGADIRQIVEDAKRTTILAGAGGIKETEILRRIARINVAEFASPDVPVEEKLRKTRDLNPKVFTYRRLAELFEVSVGHVSNLLKRGEQSNG